MYKDKNIYCKSVNTHFRVSPIKYNKSKILPTSSSPLNAAASRSTLKSAIFVFGAEKSDQVFLPGSCSLLQKGPSIPLAFVLPPLGFQESKTKPTIIILPPGRPSFPIPCKPLYIQRTYP